MGGTMRLGADPVKLHEGTQGARDLRRGRHLQAPPPPLRGQQPAAAPARRRGPGLRRHLARRAPGRDGRAARPPVLRRLPVPPRVQLAAEPARAAVPRVRRRRRRATPASSPPTSGELDARPRTPTSSDVGAPPLRLSAPSRLALRPWSELDGCTRPSSGSARSAARPARSARSPTRVAAELRALGLEVSEDDAAGPAEAGAGNLLARLPGSGDEWVMFCAHIDTVPHRGQVEVVERRRRLPQPRRDDPRRRQQGRGRGLHGAGRAPRGGRRRRSGSSCVLTVAEEQGLRGAKAFDTSVAALASSASSSTTPGRSAR